MSNSHRYYKKITTHTKVAGVTAQNQIVVIPERNCLTFVYFPVTNGHCLQCRLVGRMLVMNIVKYDGTVIMSSQPQQCKSLQNLMKNSKLPIKIDSTTDLSISSIGKTAI